MERIKLIIDKLGKREKILLGVLIFIGFLSLYYNYFYIPLANKINELHNYNSEVQNEINKVRSLPTHISQLENNYEILKQKIIWEFKNKKIK